MDSVLDGIGDFFSDAVDVVTGFASDGLEWVLTQTVYRILYYIVTGVCWLIDLCFNFFEIFGGLKKIKYGNTSSYLVNIFFSNTLITNIYWQMAVIGMVLCIGFAMFAIGKKMFDLEHQQRQSIGTILGNTFKGILIMVSMSFIIQVTLQSTGLLMQQINSVFRNSTNANRGDSIVFTDKQFATMARVLNTIGNYSLNPSYNSTYNINSCYNTLRGDLTELAQERVFLFHYKEVPLDGSETGETTDTWQSMLQKLVIAADTRQDLPMDTVNEPVTKAILTIMEEMRTNGQFVPLKSYEEKSTSPDMPWGTMIFLLGTLNSAHNPLYNEAPSFDDALRGPYYRGEKDYQDFDTVTEDFSISIVKYNYVLVFVMLYLQIVPFFAICISFLYRIFNMLILYIVSPLTISTLPLDDGTKFKQWSTAFIIQTFGAFSGMIAMQLFYVCATILFDPILVLFENSMLNMIAKMMVLMGFLYALRKVNNMITGILADNAGGEAISAGNAFDNVTALENWMDKRRHKSRDEKREKLKEAQNRLRNNGGGSGSGGQTVNSAGNEPLNQTNLQNDKTLETPQAVNNATALGEDKEAIDKVSAVNKAKILETSAQKIADKKPTGNTLSHEQYAHMFGSGKKPALNKEMKPIAGTKVGGNVAGNQPQANTSFSLGSAGKVGNALEQKKEPVVDPVAIGVNQGGARKVGEGVEQKKEPVVNPVATGVNQGGARKVGEEVGQGQSIAEKKIAYQTKLFGAKAASTIRERIMGANPDAIPSKRPPAL